MSGVVGAAAIPTAPLLLTGASPGLPAAIHDDVARLRALVHDAITALPAADVAVLVAEGDAAVHRHAVASLSALGVPSPAREFPVDHELAAQLADDLGYPTSVAPLPIAHAVLALLAASAGRSDATVSVSVPGDSAFEVLVAIGVAIDGAARTVGRRAVVVCAGDLSAGLGAASPRPDLDGAIAWDEAAVDAFADGDLRALAALGPDAAAQVVATGWASLSVLAGACAAAQLRPGAASYLAPRGVGQLVATCR